ncbi:O-methyltransferase [Antrihabitans sp. YC2-6]|uniref:O-methyltransferase n=1 Tax=Antrihabitans sp. YC2-6 TaxID=2799498 RepID=UPI0018F4798E|nr:class I SAM-dependent methyltransferase [Antrihabitans sp. YC2-6]MBJ8344632.1 class I SAM-dependent methyltransferase [Antrihabitans sp. YC2-6]
MKGLGDASLDELLDRLYAANTGQEAGVIEYFTDRAKSGTLDWRQLDDDANRFLADKLVALDRDKALFCHRLCVALRARRVVEAGTSHGVSTLHLAQAVRLVAEEDRAEGVVIATEYEPDKAAVARRNFEAAGLSKYIDLREGDLRETLAVIEGPVDFALIDIWTEMARPALERIAPQLRPGAVVIADNTASFATAYEPYFDYVNDPANGFVTQTLPFDGGLEMTIKL